jgi:alkylation response protein AidB-like acyl-CoA dehydrogenase
LPTNAPSAPARAGRALEAAQSLLPALAAAEREHDLAGRYAADNIRLAAGAGLFLLNVPESHGGFGEPLGGTVETLRTVANGSPSTALMLAMQSNILAHYLLDPQLVPAAERASFVAQREWAWCEAAAGRVFAVANSEPGAGGDVKNSRAEIRDGRLYGVKSFCSMGTNASYYMAAARDASGRVDYYLAANEPERVSVATEWNAVGMRSSESVSLRFDGARIIAPLGYRGMLDGPNNRHWSTLSFTAVFVGIAESLLDDVRSPKSGILQRASAVDLHLTVQACRAFVRHCVDAEPFPPDAEYRRLVRDCKLFVTRSLAQHASAVWLALGGSAYRFDSPVSRKVRDLLAGPAVRPPVGVSFDELWDELEKENFGRSRVAREAGGPDSTIGREIHT